MPAIIELTIRRLQDSSLVAELRAELLHNHADLGSALVTISGETLRGLRLLPDAYGAALAAMILPQALHPAWQRARGYAEREGMGFHVRVRIDDHTGELLTLCWELLRDPLTNTPLAQQEGGSLARLITLDDLHDPVPPTRPELRTLVAVAGPSDIKRYGLAPVDVAGEAERVRAALGDLPANLLADTEPGAANLATLDNLRDRLRGTHLFTLICHGQTTEAGTALYLVGADGRAAPITGADLAAEISALDAPQRPLCAVLIACEGASQDKAPLATVGPLLARAGVSAVVAMQATVTMAAAAGFTARLLREVVHDGRIDRALAAARKEMGNEWWVPALWLRSRDGRLWKKQFSISATHSTISTQEQRTTSSTPVKSTAIANPVASNSVTLSEPIVQPAKSSAYYRIAYQNEDLRGEPKANGAVYLTIPRGRLVKKTGLPSVEVDGEMYEHVRFESVQGWVRSDYIIPTQPKDQQPRARVQMHPPNQQGLSVLNPVTTTPSHYKVLSYLSEGSEVEILEGASPTNPQWVLIKVDVLTGLVIRRHLSLIEP